MLTESQKVRRFDGGLHCHGECAEGVLNNQGTPLVLCPFLLHLKPEICREFEAFEVVLWCQCFLQILLYGQGDSATRATSLCLSLRQIRYGFSSLRLLG